MLDEGTSALDSMTERMIQVCVWGGRAARYRPRLGAGRGRPVRARKHGEGGVPEGRLPGCGGSALLTRSLLPTECELPARSPPHPQESLAGMRQQCTTVIVAHRLSTVADGAALPWQPCPGRRCPLRPDRGPGCKGATISACFLHPACCSAVAHLCMPRLPAPARAADLTLVFDGGSIVEAGSHAELLQRGGVYAAMWQRQLEGAASFSQQAEVPAVAAGAAKHAGGAGGAVPTETAADGAQSAGERGLGHQLTLSRATSQAFTENGNEQVEEEDSGEQPEQTPSP